MEMHTYIPNEQQAIAMIRYDASQITSEALRGALEKFMGELGGTLRQPIDNEPGDGALDWSLTSIDNPEDEIQAEVWTTGPAVRVDSVVPVRIIDEETYVSEIWLDGRLLREEIMPLTGDTNRVRLANGLLQERIKELRNSERMDIKPKRALATIGALPGYWDRALEGECGLPDCTARAYAINAALQPEVLCEIHFSTRDRLVQEGRLGPKGSLDGYLVWVDGDEYDAFRLALWLERNCLLCNTAYAEHYGERCPTGTGTFRWRLDFIGYDADGGLLFWGDEARLAFTTAGVRLDENLINPDDYLAELRRKYDEQTAGEWK